MPGARSFIIFHFLRTDCWVPWSLFALRQPRWRQNSSGTHRWRYPRARTEPYRDWGKEAGSWKSSRWSSHVWSLLADSAGLPIYHFGHLNLGNITGFFNIEASNCQSTLAIFSCWSNISRTITNEFPRITYLFLSIYL